MERLPWEIIELILDFVSTNLFFRRRYMTPWLNRPFEDRLSCCLSMPRDRGTRLADSPLGYYMIPREDNGRGIGATGDDGCFVYRRVHIYISTHRRWRPAFFHDDHDEVVCFESHSRGRAVDKFSQWSPSADLGRMIGYWYPTQHFSGTMTPSALLRAHCDMIDAFM